MRTINKNKIFKIVICLCLAFTFMFAQPKQNMQQAEAILPAIILAVLGSIVLDVAVDMGIKFVDKKAAKDWADNIVGKLWNKHGKLISDLKPTKMNGLKWGLRIGKGLLALIVDEIVDSTKEVKNEDTKRKEENVTPKIYNNEMNLITSDPFYKTDVNIKGFIQQNVNDINEKKSYAYINEWLNFQLTPVSYAQRTKFVISADKTFGNTGDAILYIKGGFNSFIELRYTGNSIYLYDPVVNSYVYDTASDTSADYKTSFIIKDNLVNGVYQSYTGIFSAYPAFLKYLERLENSNAKTYYSDGIITSDYDGYLDLPDDKTITEDIINDLDFTKFPIAIQNDKDFEFELGDITNVDADYEVINEGDQFEWELIEQDIVNQGDNLYSYDIDYNYAPVVNNYYSISAKQQEEIDTDIETGVIVPPTNGGGGNGSVDGFMYCVDKPGAMIVSCKDIEAIDGGLISYIKNSYDYAVNAVKAGADGLQSILAGSAGLIALYSNIFDWLPEEVTILLTSGLLLMIGLRVFRK